MQVGDAEASERVTIVRLDSLALWARNYRRGDVQAIKRSIQRFGFNAALRVRGSTVYAGNHSVKALREMASEGDPPPLGIEVLCGEWCVPVILIDHLSETEAEAFALADNRSQEIGANDETALGQLLCALKSADESLPTVAGFTPEQLEAFRGAENPKAGNANRISDSSDTSEPSRYLRWSACSVQLSDEEVEGLTEALNRYISLHGTSFGFIRGILGL